MKRCVRLLHRCTPHNHSQYFPSRYLLSTQSKIPKTTPIKSKKNKESSQSAVQVEIETVSNNDNEIDSHEEDDIEHEDDSAIPKKRLKPQEELLESWYITLDDRVETLTQHIKSLSRKGPHILGATSALVTGSVAWIQFGLLDMPFETKLVMSHLPILLCFGHWYYLYYKSQILYKKLEFEKVIDVPYYNNDIKKNDTKKPPVIIDLIDVNSQQSMDAVNGFCKLVPQTKRFAQISTLFSMCAVSTLLMVNPLADSLITELQPYQMVFASMYPIVPFAYTLIIHWGHLSNVPLLTELINEEIEEEKNRDDESDDDDDSIVYCLNN